MKSEQNCLDRANSKQAHRCRRPLVILWMAMWRDEITHAFSKTFVEAVRLEGRQKWDLALSSSAQVTQMTYQTVIGVRCPELVTVNPTGFLAA